MQTEELDVVGIGNAIVDIIAHADDAFLAHEDLQKGGTLEFKMGATPEKSRGTAPSAYPYSYSTANK